MRGVKSSEGQSIAIRGSHFKQEFLWPPHYVHDSPLKRDGSRRETERNMMYDLLFLQLSNSKKTSRGETAYPVR
jgi:hypothetical protein